MTRERRSPRVGISAWMEGYDADGIGPELDRIEGLDVDTVEIPTFMLDLVAGGRVIPGKLANVKHALADRSFGYTAHGPIGINFFDERWRTPLHFDVLAASIEVAAEIGAEHYVMHTGILPRSAANPAELDSAYDHQRHHLERAAQLAADAGLIIVVENVFADHAERTALPSRLAVEVAAINHPSLRACFDVSHGAINATMNGVDLLTEAEAIAPFACHVHVHDSFGQPRAGLATFSQGERLAFGVGDLHLPLGLGTIPWDDLMARCVFPAGTIFNIELQRRYWSDVPKVVARTRELAAAARIAPANGTMAD